MNPSNSESSVWEDPQRLESWAGAYEPVRVATSCESLPKLLRSESFKAFLRIFNAMNRRDAIGMQVCAGEPVTGKKIMQDKCTRDRAYALWNRLQLQGKVDVIRDLDDSLQEWMMELDEVEELERDLQSRRRDILGS